jgi:hypothetical protein
VEIERDDPVDAGGDDEVGDELGEVMGVRGATFRSWRAYP